MVPIKRERHYLFFINDIESAFRAKKLFAQLCKNNVNQHPTFNFECTTMTIYLAIKAIISAFIIVLVSETARRNPGTGALIASLPLISVLSMIWLWRDTKDTARMADHASATFWYVLPSLPMFLIIPALLRRGFGFWPSLAAGCLVTMALFGLMMWMAPRFGLKL